MTRRAFRRLLGRFVCSRRGHRIQQQPSPTPDPLPHLVLACTRCGLVERHELRRLNRAERRTLRYRPRATA